MFEIHLNFPWELDQGTLEHAILGRWRDLAWFLRVGLVRWNSNDDHVTARMKGVNQLDIDVDSLGISCDEMQGILFYRRGARTTMWKKMAWPKIGAEQLCISWNILKERLDLWGAAMPGWDIRSSHPTSFPPGQLGTRLAWRATFRSMNYEIFILVRELLYVILYCTRIPW